MDGLWDAVQRGDAPAAAYFRGRLHANADELKIELRTKADEAARRHKIWQELAELEAK